MHGGRMIDAAQLLSRAIESGGDRVMFVGAHPDDETFAMGGQLGKLPQISIVIVTDGAPRDLRDATKAGFDTAEAYAAARALEMRNALAEAGIDPARLTMLGVPDQQPIQHLPQLARGLAELFAETIPLMVFTHAYEGGHPDHDAVAFAVHAAAELLRRQFGEPPVIIEMPYYRPGDDGSIVQGFAPLAGSPVHVVELDDESFGCKTRMMSRHESQARLFGGTGFRSRRESFRIAPEYDFRRPPNDGRVLYEAWHLGISGPEWTHRARGAIAALGLAR
jgi:LmbE family N-acetylglucosaminyl deacetylase